METGKKYQTTSSHTLFPAWECKQIWLLRSFLPTIDFTSPQFPQSEKQPLSTASIYFEIHYVFLVLCVTNFHQLRKQNIAIGYITKGTIILIKINLISNTENQPYLKLSHISPSRTTFAKWLSHCPIYVCPLYLTAFTG